MRRALLFCAAIAFAIACGADITEPIPDRTLTTPPVALATTSTDDGLSITTDKDDYAPGDTVHFTGAGWPANDVLDIQLDDEPATHLPHTWTINVAEDGTFHDSTYVVDLGDFGVTFTLTATSRTTGRSLTVTFTDGKVRVQSNLSGVTFSLKRTTFTTTNCTGTGTALTNVAITNSATEVADFTTGSLLLEAPATSVQGDDFVSWTGEAFTIPNPPNLARIICVTAANPTRVYAANYDAVDLTVAKSHVGNFAAGNTGVYSIVVTNDGSVSTSGGIVLTDQLPTGLTYNSNTTTSGWGTCTGGGQTITCSRAGGGGQAIPSGGGTSTIQITVNVASSASGTLTNNVSVAGGGEVTPGPSNGNNSASDPTTVIPQVAPTTLVVQAATGTYGGQVDLSATLKAGTTALGGKTVAFTLNGHPVGTATTNVTTGIATLSGVYLSDDGTFDGTRIGVNTYASGVGASYAGDAGPPAFGTSSGTAQLKVDPKSVTPSITANNKIYDRTTAATIASRSLSGVLGTDDVTLTGGSATFADKDVGNGKLVTATGLSLVGTAAGNYLLTSTSATTSADITEASLVPHITAANKEYDRTTSATILTRTLSGVISPDVVTLTGGTANFASKDVGTHQVTGSGFSLAGAAAGNYKLDPFTATTTASISQRALAVTATGVSREYDRTINATVTLDDDRIPGDVLTVAYASAKFLDKNVGTAKHISVTGISISGTDAGNYLLNSTTASATANITARPLAVSATGVNKVYDGTTAASVSLSDDRVTGDVLNVTYTSATFADKHVGDDKQINVSGINVTGTDANNYDANTTATGKANITQRPITVTAKSDNKQYDRTTSSDKTPEITDGSLAPGGDVASFTQTFDSKNVGTGKTLTPAGTVTDGNGGGNYKVTFVDNHDGIITAKPVTAAIVANDKDYDRTTTATLSSKTVSGVISPDDVTLVVGAANFDTRSAGTNKTVTATGLSLAGADAGNYELTSTTATTAATIRPRPLVVSASAADKYFDANTTASVTLTFTPLSGDFVTVSYTSATFNNASVGNGKTVTVAGLTTGGTDGANYDPNPPAHTAITTANILPWTLAGFYQPVDMPLQGGAYSIVWNNVKGGSTVPLKFEVFRASTELKDLNVVQPLFTKEVACGVGLTDNIEVTATGGTVLRFDPTGDQFIYNWQTPKKPGYCYQVTMKTADASTLVAFFQLK